MRQLLTESAILAVAGGGLGLLVGAWVVDIFMLTSASDYFRPYEVAMSVPVLVYALVISTVAALFFGLAPALAAARGSVNETLKEGGASSSAGMRRNRLRSGLVVAQLALGLPMFVLLWFGGAARADAQVAGHRRPESRSSDHHGRAVAAAPLYRGGPEGQRFLQRRSRRSQLFPAWRRAVPSTAFPSEASGQCGERWWSKATKTRRTIGWATSP